MTLNVADAVLLGSTPADKVYLGSTLVWESTAPPQFSPLDISWNNAFWADDLGYAAPADGADITVAPTDHGSSATTWSLNNTPTWVSDMAGTGKPALSSIGINGLYSPSQSVPGTRTVAIVGRALGAFQDSDFFDTYTTGNERSLFDTNGGKWRLFGGSNLQTTADADNGLHLFIAKFVQFGNETLEIDGVQVLDGDGGTFGITTADLWLGGAGAWGAGNVDGVEIAFAGYIHRELTAQEKSDLLSWFQSEYVATYSLFPGPTPQIVRDQDTADVSLSTEFYVTSAASVTKLRALRPTDPYTWTQGIELALYEYGNTTPLYQSGAIDVGTEVAGVWYEHTLPAPYALTPDQRYYCTVWWDQGGYAAIGGYFNAGGAGRDTLVQGPLVRPNDADSVEGQGRYNYGPSIEYPEGTFNAGCYFSDVIVVV